MRLFAYHTPVVATLGEDEYRGKIIGYANLAVEGGARLSVGYIVQLDRAITITTPDGSPCIFRVLYMDPDFVYRQPRENPRDPLRGPGYNRLELLAQTFLPAGMDLENAIRVLRDSGIAASRMTTTQASEILTRYYGTPPATMIPGPDDELEEDEEED